MQRWLIGLVTALGIVFLLYILMAELIKSNLDIPKKKDDFKLIDIVLVEEEDPLKIRVRQKPKKKPPPKEPPPPQIQKISQLNKPLIKRLDLKIERPTINNLGDVFIGPGGGPSSDGDAIPEIQMTPIYPEEALTRGTEGSVTFIFTISVDGTPKDLKVVEPSDRIFVRNARRSIRRWRFKPKIVNGKPVEQPGMTYTLEFELEKK